MTGPPRVVAGRMRFPHHGRRRLAGGSFCLSAPAGLRLFAAWRRARCQVLMLGSVCLFARECGSGVAWVAFQHLLRLDACSFYRSRLAGLRAVAVGCGPPATSPDRCFVTSFWAVMLSWRFHTWAGAARVFRNTLTRLLLPHAPAGFRLGCLANGVARVWFRPVTERPA